MDARKNYIYIQPRSEHTHTLIFLHGLGDSAEGFEPVFEEGGPLYFPNLKVILPTAPKRAVTLNNGYMMNSWFDIFSSDENITQKVISKIQNDEHNEALKLVFQEYDKNELDQSVNHVLELIQEEKKLFEDQSEKRIFIGGFSQGCMVSLATLLKYQGQQPLAGVIGLSGILCINYDQEMNIKEPSLELTLNEKKIQQIQQTPLFLYLGERDHFFNVHVAELTYDILKQGYTDQETGKLSENFVYNREKGLTHSTSQKEMQLLNQWITQKMSM